jgi:hypothetical protein
MQHKAECSKGEAEQYSGPQREQLLTEFHAQPMQREMRDRAHVLLDSGMSPEELAKSGAPLFADQMPARIQRSRQIRAAEPIKNYGETRTPAAARWWQFWRWFD